MKRSVALARRRVTRVRRSTERDSLMAMRLKFCWGLVSLRWSKGGAGSLGLLFAHHHYETLFLAQAFVDLADGVEPCSILEPLETCSRRRAQRYTQHADVLANLVDIAAGAVRAFFAVEGGAAAARAAIVGQSEDVRVFEAGKRRLLLLEHAVDDDFVALVQALQHRELAADTVQALNVRQLGLLQHLGAQPVQRGRVLVLAPCYQAVRREPVVEEVIEEQARRVAGPVRSLFLTVAHVPPNGQHGDGGGARWVEGLGQITEDVE